MASRGLYDWSAASTRATIHDLDPVEIARLRSLLLAAGRLELADLDDERILANLRTLDQLAIHDLRTKNTLLQEAYLNLKAAQAELVEKERLEREMELAARRLAPVFRKAPSLAVAVYHLEPSLLQRIPHETMVHVFDTFR